MISANERYSNISAWVCAVPEAREEVKVKGFVPVNGKSKGGKALYLKAKVIDDLGKAGVEST